LTLCGWIPRVLHALFVVSNAKAEARNNKLIRVMQGKTPTMGAGEALALGGRSVVRSALIACGVVGALMLFLLVAVMLA